MGGHILLPTVHIYQISMLQGSDLVLAFAAQQALRDAVNAFVSIRRPCIG